jgi:hypothetical protein
MLQPTVMYWSFTEAVWYDVIPFCVTWPGACSARTCVADHATQETSKISECKRGPFDGYEASCMMTLHHIIRHDAAHPTNEKSLWVLLRPSDHFCNTDGRRGSINSEFSMVAGIISPYQEAGASPPTLKYCLAACHPTSADGSLVRSPMDDVEPPPPFAPSTLAD